MSAALTAAANVVAWQDYGDGTWTPNWCYWAAIDPQACLAALDRVNFPPPTRVPPPPAPQTVDEMTTWTPDEMLAEYRRQTAAWARGAIPDGPPEPAAGTPWLVWAGLGLGVVVLLKAFRN